MLTPILFATLTLATAAIATRFLLAHPDRPVLRALPVRIALWLIFTAAMVASGALSDYALVPTPAMRIMIPGLILTLYLALSRTGHAVASSFSFRGLILFQAFRLPLEIMLYMLHREGHIPIEMTFSGLNFDVLTGISAIILYYAVQRRQSTTRWIWLWNVGGLMLLVNMVTIAIVSMPGRTHLLHTSIPNTLISEFPYVWITFFVLAALFGHVVIFRKLRMASVEATTIATTVAI